MKASLESTNKKLQDLEQERQAIAHLKLKNEQLSKELSEKATSLSTISQEAAEEKQKFGEQIDLG